MACTAFIRRFRKTSCRRWASICRIRSQGTSCTMSIPGGTWLEISLTELLTTSSRGMGLRAKSRTRENSSSPLTISRARMTSCSTLVSIRLRKSKSP
jgi:hypothetical protein